MIDTKVIDHTGNPLFDGGSIGLSSTKEPDYDSYAKSQPEPDLELVMALQSFWNESDSNRKSGLNPREDKWRENLNLYWNRYDFSKKAQWQSRETMPEVPAFVDRFAAAMKESLISGGGNFYEVIDPADEEGDIAEAVQRMTDVFLTHTGRSPSGQLLPFSAVFEEQMKLGALMACCASVTWKNDVPGGRVAIESNDPRFVWLDHTGRNMYRIRRTEIDRHELQAMLTKKDKRGKPLFKLENMASLINSLTLYDMVYKQEMAGHGIMTSSARAPITLDEYIATAVNNQGEVIADRSLMVVANQKFLIRGPEKNPFWHGQDWMVYTPLVPTPLSVYGRTYMEDFGSVAHAFTELTNLLLDAAYMASMKAWVMAPSALANPAQVGSGITPNKIFYLDEGMDPKSFAEALELGTLSKEGVEMWQLLKNELNEASSVNEIGMGQFAPKGRTSATEINATQMSSSAIVRSVAQVVETRFLDIILDLTWKTGLQHVKQNDEQIAAAIGKEMFGALYSQRKKLIERPFTFQARGISNTIERAQQLKSLMTIFQIVGSSQPLMEAFFQEVPAENLLNKLFQLSGIDFSKMQATQRQQAMMGLQQQIAQAKQNANPGTGGSGGSGGKGGQKVPSGQAQQAVGGLGKMFNQGKAGQPTGSMS